MEIDKIVTLMRDLVLAVVFMWAWLQERAERRENAKEAQSRIDAVNQKMYDLLRDITIARPTNYHIPTIPPTINTQSGL